MLGWLQLFGLGGVGVGGTATLSESALSEQQVANGYFDIYVTLTGVTWVDGYSFLTARQSIIDGFVSAQSESGGWNAQVRDKLSVSAVTRLSDATVVVRLHPTGYMIASNEIITFTAASGTNSGGSALIATPTITVTAATASGTEVVNDGAEASTNSGYELCPVSGFKQYPLRDPFSQMRERWDGEIVRGKSLDMRHPQEYLTSLSSRQTGPQHPEPSTDTEVGTVSQDDL
jgi:hypothetical protein